MFGLFMLCALLAGVTFITSYALILDLIIPVLTPRAMDYGSPSEAWTMNAVYRRIRPTLISLLLLGVFLYLASLLTPFAF
jgi:hypothetical protein